MEKRLIAVAWLVATFGMHVQADHGCNGTVSQIDVGGQTVYLDDRSAGGGVFDHWIYLESNGVEGLQTGGDNTILTELPGIVDACQHRLPDTLVV